MVYSYVETGEIHQYIKAMRQIDLMKIKNKREADKMLSPQVPVRYYKLKIFVWYCIHHLHNALPSLLKLSLFYSCNMGTSGLPEMSI